MRQPHRSSVARHDLPYKLGIRNLSPSRPFSSCAGGGCAEGSRGGEMLGWRTTLNPRGAPSLVQRIYDVLMEIHDPRDEASAADTSAVLKTVTDLLAGMKREDLGVTERDLQKWRAPKCLQVVESEKFDMTIFFLPEGGCLPLHDHPGMAVLTKLVEGRMELYSYDMLSATGAAAAAPMRGENVGREGRKRDRESRRKGRSTSAIRARQAKCEILESQTAMPWMLTPTRGNIHELNAITPCLLFDVLLPPYELGDLRPCKYFQRDHEGRGGDDAEGGDDGSSSDEVVVLREVDEPSFLPSRAPYTGPRVLR